MRPLLSLLALLIASVAVADNPILLITPKGVYIAEVENGVPGEFKPFSGDVIIRGFGTPPTPKPDDPKDPPPPGNAAGKVSELAKIHLKTREEATAIVAIIDSLQSSGLSGEKLKEALLLVRQNIDDHLKSSGRVSAFLQAVLAVTDDGSVLKAGVSSAFGVASGSIDTIRKAVDPNGEVTAEALDFAQIIAIVQLILQLLKNLGVIS